MSVLTPAKCGTVIIGLVALCAVEALAQSQPVSTSAGPGRIICRSVSNCELGIGTPPSIRYRIDASALPDADKDRLVKQCTAKAPPCVATVNGADGKTGIMAANIKFYN